MPWRQLLKLSVCGGQLEKKYSRDLGANTPAIARAIHPPPARYEPIVQLLRHARTRHDKLQMVVKLCARVICATRVVEPLRYLFFLAPSHASSPLDTLAPSHASSSVEQNLLH